MFRFCFFKYVLFVNKGQDVHLKKDAFLLKFEHLLIIKQYPANSA